MTSWLNLIPWIVGYKLHRALGRPKTMPINMTISVTNMCNSRCKTCFIWRLYQDHPELKKTEFKTEEFERTFENLGEQIFYVVISGGEPYLRQDLPRICEALCDCSHPAILVIPTNGLLPSVIENKTKDILRRCPDVTLKINLSLDGIGNEHDEVRGVIGNFEKFLEIYELLKKLKTEFSRLQIGIHTVISKFNIHRFLPIMDYVERLNPDSYITEVAERRTELFNVDKDIVPDPYRYSKFMNELSRRILKSDLYRAQSVSKITQAFRLTYYQIVAQELTDCRQIIPCYAGYASCQITPYGDVWPCCVLGYDKSMGNLREKDYDFRRIWHSKRADEVRSFIKSEKCACPLANAHYTNILCNFTSLIKVILNFASIQV